jgi:lysyl endopeptidase
MEKIFRLSLLLILISGRVASGQLESTAGSLSEYKTDSFYEIRIDSQLLKTMEGLKQPKNAPFQFALPVPVNLNPKNSGKFFYNQSETVWILGIRSKSAKSLNLILQPFKLPKGAYVYIFDSQRRTIRGAFTDENNSTSGILATMPVPGEELMLEYHIPSGTSWENTIGVSQVAHDYLGVFGNDESKDSRYGLSDSCNIDINCSSGALYSTEKRAVCRVIIRGVELCSGVLLNNTNHQNRALFLTAHHCIADQNDADKSVFLFGYESPWCKGPDGRVYHSVSGSTLRSTNPESDITVDFSLVELNTFPPMVYKPYLAGWDVSGTIPTRTVTIHHPMGDVKKISLDLDPPVNGTFPEMLSNGFWRILRWNGGTTEGGSSGAPLLDQNKRVVGLLTGGDAYCLNPVDDYFLKMSVIYNHSSLLYQQIKGWIDPAVSGAKQLNGRDPYAQNQLTADTLSNILPSETVTATKYSLPWNGYTTGFNSDSLIMYGEYFNNPSGNRISEVWLNIAKDNAVSSGDSVRVYVMADGSEPGAVIASQKIFIREARDNFKIKTDFNDAVPVPGNFYIGWRIWYGAKAVNETRQFAVFHSPDRTLPEMNTAWFRDLTGWKKFIQHPYAPMSTSLDITVITVSNSVLNSVPEIHWSEGEFIFYPNPAVSQVTISSKRVAGQVYVTMMDNTGKTVLYKKIENSFPGEALLNISQFKPGLYFISISDGIVIETRKILINR